MNNMPRKILILGGTNAAYEAACVCRKMLPEAEITILEASDIFAYYDEGMFYYLSGDIESFDTLRSTIYGVVRDRDFFARTNGIEVIIGRKPLSIDCDNKTVSCLDLTTMEPEEYRFDKLLIAQKRIPQSPTLHGLDLPGVSYFSSPEEIKALRKAVEKSELNRVAVLGSTATGCRLCDAFSVLWGVETTLFCRSPRILGELIDVDLEPIVHNELHRSNIDHHLGVEFDGITQKNGKLTVALQNGEMFTGFDRVIIASVPKPNTELAAAAGLKVGVNGGILVDEYLRTSHRDIYAAGNSTEVNDTITGKTKLVSSGLMENMIGRVAGVNMGGGGQRIPLVVNSSLVKIFNMNIGAVGLSARTAEKAGIEFEVVRGLFSDRAFYYPEVELLSAKLLFCPKTGKILGAQVAGKGYMVRYLDIITAFIQKGGTVYNLMEFEPAFTPPLTDMDYPLHVLASYADGLMKGAVKPINPIEYKEDSKNWVLLDVRENYEVEDKPLQAPAKRIINIPFTYLKDRISELPKDEPLLAVCSRGSRSCAAANMLKNAGFAKVSYLSGGLSFFQ